MITPAETDGALQVLFSVFFGASLFKTPAFAFFISLRCLLFCLLPRMVHTLLLRQAEVHSWPRLFLVGGSFRWSGPRALLIAHSASGILGAFVPAEQCLRRRPS